MRLPEYIFDLIYDKRCKTCKNHTMRVIINKLLYRKMKGEKIDGKTITFTYALNEFDKYGIDPPTIPSMTRHYDNHIKYYIEHQSEIKEKWKTEQIQRNRAPRDKIDKEIKEQNKPSSDEDQDINNLMRQVSEKTMKITDVFPIRGYNSRIGLGGPKLNWDQWTRKFLTIKIKTPKGYIRKPMVLAKHQIDILEAIDADDSEGLQLLIARNHRKSTTLEVYGLRNLCDHQARILYISGSKDEVQRYTENIRSALKSNPRILYYYGYLPSPTRGDSKAGVYLRSLVNGIIIEDFDKDAHLTFATAPRANGGSSKLGAHPDIIIIDDMEGEEVEVSDNLKSKHKKWFDRNIMPMRNAGTKLVIAGTRKAEDDIYNYIMAKNMLFTLQRPAILIFPNDGQEEPVNDEISSDSHWSYYYEDKTRVMGNETIVDTFLVGVKNLKGGKVFWDEFRMENWDYRSIQYRKANGQHNKTLMALQELLLEKGFLEAKADQGGFSFSAEYQLKPVESKGRHFKKERIQYYSMAKWRTIVQNSDIAKYTWIDVGYSLKIGDKSGKKRKGVKSGKTSFATLCKIEGDEKGFSITDAGVYVLDVRSGNYYIDSSDPEKTLIGEMNNINELFKVEMFCFEDNFFGEYVRFHMQLFDTYDLPVDGKRNTLNKEVRISNGINALLAKPKDIGGLYLCQLANGFNVLLKQISDFPYISKMDEIDSVESCYRLMIKGHSTMEVIGDLYANDENLSIGCEVCEYYDKLLEKCNLKGCKVSEVLSCPHREKIRRKNQILNVEDPLGMNINMNMNPLDNVIKSYRRFL